MSSCSDQPQSLNFLNNNGFEFKLLNSPELNFFVTQAEIPAISLATAKQSTRYNSIDYPGEEVNYNELNIRFKIDENLNNYWNIHSWIRLSGNAISLQELYDKELEVNNNNNIKYLGTHKQGSIYSDAELYLLNGAGNKSHKIRFYDAFPVGLGNISFDTEVSKVEPLSATAAFKYIYYDFLKI